MWWSVSEEGFDIEAWIDKRRQSLFKEAAEDVDPPAVTGFDRTLWLAEAQSHGGGVTSVWYGYREQARLILEVVINDVAGEEVVAVAKDLVLASMAASEPNAPIQWAIYDTRFESPAGYDIYDSMLNLGAMSLFLRKGKERLMLCQFYPASMALAKQPLADWLETTALTGKWRGGKKDPDILECRVGPHDGLRKERALSRPFPLDLLGKTHCLSIIAHDKGLDRLLMGEHIHLTQTDDRLIVDAIGRMNWE